MRNVSRSLTWSWHGSQVRRSPPRGDHRDRVPALRRGRVRRHLDRGHRARGRDLAAVPVPAVQDQDASCSWPAGTAATSRSRRCSREAAAGAPAGERMAAMGHAYEERAAARPARADVPDAVHAMGDPEIRAHVREGFDGLRRTVARAGRCSGRGDLAASSPTGCCSTSSRCSSSTGTHPEHE